ncbi:unnamed protein product [Rotaria magnacalcarata]|uniref:Peptidyl-prolyl cis-trans isomerase n=1 Tax=Rotaria magnacalcarata TaxID=392030 RepID=A0A816GPS5_9BILA|nr:unnamed protein product [Rotaria magnacalcarata]
MDIAIQNKIIGRIIFKLFHNVPKTAQNFQALCAGEDYLCYVGSKFTHVFPQYIIRGGDITSFDGSNGESIFGKHFPDENFKNKHNKPGILSMVNAGPNTNSSQFFITSVALPYFDDKYPGGSSCRLKGHRKRPETAIKRHKTTLIFTLFRRVNQRFTRLVHDSVFTNRLTLTIGVADGLFDRLDNQKRERFRLQILPSIRHKIEWLGVEASSLEDILLCTSYPNLYGLGLHGIEENTALRIFTDETPLTRLL